jgi:hypothetical protein
MSNQQNLSFVFYALIAYVATAIFLMESEKPNEAQKKIIGNVTEASQKEFLTFACKAKSICKGYPDIKQGCAEAGSIQKCIDIRMQGEDSSICLDNGGVVGLDDKTRPGFAQCAAFKIFGLVK